LRLNGTLIELKGITKRFGGALALDGVSFEIAPGEIHAIVGENGAGKSTLMKLLAGVHSADIGQVLLRGRPVQLRSPQAARRHGISIVFQELNLFPHRSVAANIFANNEMVWGRLFLDQRAMREAARQALAAIGCALDPVAMVGRLSVGERQLVEIARALQQQAEILILDEPNSALQERESTRLFEIVRHLRQEGITILYVSHRLEEVFAIADRISVLRDGRFQGTWRTAETTPPEIIAAMIGRRIEDSFPERPTVPAGNAVALSVRDLSHGEAVGPISFEVRRGEILGFAGLHGAGVEDLFHVLFGLEPMTGGTVYFHDRPVRVRSPVEALRQGWGLIPASRREQGLMMDWSVHLNTTLLILGRLMNRLGLIDAPRARRRTEEYVRRLNVATDSIDKKVVYLSGGNQQKVLLARWLATGPAVLLLNDPTRGVDVGAKADIYELCRELAQQGLAVLFTASEVDEILGLCDRVLVLSRGRVAREFGRGQATKALVTHWMSGGSDEESGAAEPIRRQ
jgi:ribose transport system ATP-binding protein